MKTISTLFSVIEDHTDFNRADLAGDSRLQELVDAREIFVRVCREELKYSYVRIARYLNRDHTSIIHLYRRHQVDEFEYTEVIEAFNKLWKTPVENS